MKNKRLILLFVSIFLISSVNYLYSSEHRIMSPWEKSGSNVSTAVSTDNVGIGENAPETDLEITSTAPYITLHNSTDEKTDGGMESRIRFKGEDPNGVEWHLATIQASHDGTTADGKADIIFSNNDGNDTDDNLQERMRIDSSGNVGIGTTSPNSKLHISGIDPIIRLSNTETNGKEAFIQNIVSGTDGYTRFYNGAYICGLWSNSGVSIGSIYFSTKSPSNGLIVEGNVGIGTTSPDALFHAEKSTALTSTQQEVGRISVTTTGTPAAGFGCGWGFELETDANSAGHMEVVGGIYGIIEDPNIDIEDGAILIKTMTEGAAATEKMRISSNGCIGIGTGYAPSPFVANSKALDIASNSNAEIILDHTDAGSTSAIGDISWARNNDQLAYIRGCIDGSTDAAYISVTTQPTGGELTERWRVSSDGTIKIIANNGSSINEGHLTEEVTIPVGSGADPVVESSTNLAPAGSLILGCTFYITDAPGGGAATLDIGITGSGDLDDLIDGASCDILGETGDNFTNGDADHLGIARNISAATLTLTTDADVTDDLMKVRIIIFYRDLNVPTS